jgi:hypothetical protein
MKMRNSATHQTSMHESFNKTVSAGKNIPREYHIGGRPVACKKGMLPTEGIYPVVFKAKSALRHGIAPAKKGRGTGREPELY